MRTLKENVDHVAEKTRIRLIFHPLQGRDNLEIQRWRQRICLARRPLCLGLMAAARAVSWRRSPLHQDRHQIRFPHRFAQIIIHASLQTTDAILGHRIGGHRNNGYMTTALRLLSSNQACRL